MEPKQKLANKKFFIFGSGPGPMERVLVCQDFDFRVLGIRFFKIILLWVFSSGFWA